MSNTKARHQEIAAQAALLLVAHDLSQLVPVRLLAKQLMELTDCHYSTAKRHIARSARVARGTWGGTRPGAGRPTKESDE